MVVIRHTTYFILNIYSDILFLCLWSEFNKLSFMVLEELLLMWGRPPNGCRFDLSPQPPVCSLFVFENALPNFVKPRNQCGLLNYFVPVSDCFRGIIMNLSVLNFFGCEYQCCYFQTLRSNPR